MIQSANPYLAGHALVSLSKAAASHPITYALSGRLQLSRTGWLVLHVPALLVRGVFDALDAAGLELPKDYHIPVMSPQELDGIGGADRLTERGHRYAYSLGTLHGHNPYLGGVSRVLYLKVHSPDLVTLRRSYGLSDYPKGDVFQLVVGVRRTGVITPGSVKKSDWDDLEQEPDWTVFSKEAIDLAVNVLDPETIPPEEGSDEDLAQLDRVENVPVAKESSYAKALNLAAKTIDRNPTPAQQEAGNARVGHINMHGMRISIEVAAGGVREKIGPDGKKWRRVMRHAYGRIRGSVGDDGDHLDCFIGPHTDSEKVFVVQQLKEDKTPDEKKILIGWRDQESARKGYLANYPKDWDRLGDIKTMTMDEFKEWAFEKKAGVPEHARSGPLRQLPNGLMSLLAVGAGDIPTT